MLPPANIDAAKEEDNNNSGGGGGGGDEALTLALRQNLAISIGRLAGTNTAEVRQYPS
jgi:hypothetical protein